MNIRAIANGLTASVNPNISATLLKNTGSTTAASGSRAPAFSATTAMIQVQGVSAKDLQFLASQNISGTVRQVFAPGYWQGPNKTNGTGGDVFKFPEFEGGSIRDWKVVAVKGVYSGWTQTIVQLQTGSITIPEDE